MYNIPNIFLAAAASIEDVMNNGMSFQEKTSMSLEMLADGLGTVFLVLIILWGMLSLCRVIFYDIPNKRKSSASSDSDKADSDTVDEESAVYDADTLDAEDETQLIAVITAAVAAYREAENLENGVENSEADTSFRVVSFRRAKSGEWNKGSR